MGSGLREYHDGQQLRLRVRVVSAKDKGGIVVDMGGLHMPIPHRHLDAADTNPQRPMTPEEQDRAEMEAGKE